MTNILCLLDKFFKNETTSTSFPREAELLRQICQDTNNERRQAIEHVLQARGISYLSLREGTLVVPAKNEDKTRQVVLSAHYDVVAGSKGYNDNGMSVVTILGLLGTLPDNVEVVFTNGEETGFTGVKEYLRSRNSSPKACVNLDVCGCFDMVYLDPMNCPEALALTDCRQGKMPSNDACAFASAGVPSACFSTGPSRTDFRTGIVCICFTLHNREHDNDFSLLNFGVIPKVQKQVHELIGRINSNACAA